MNKFIKICATVSLFVSPLAMAQENTQVHDLVLVDGVPVTNVHYAVFAAQQEATGAGEQDQLGLLNELVNTFMVANSTEAKALAEHPEIKATLEVTKARLLAQALVRETLNNAEISEAEYQAQYKADYLDQKLEEFKARHILLETEEAANSVIDALRKGGDFAALAKEKSTGPSSSVGGDLGWFAPDQMVPEFSKAVSSMTNTEFSETPVKTQFGWHVILREDSRNKEIPALDAIKTQLAKVIRQRKVSELVNTIRDRTNLEILEVEENIK